MPNQHKTGSISWHPKDPTLKPWIEAEAGIRGTTKSEILDEALAEYRAQAEFQRPFRDADATGTANRVITAALTGHATLNTETEEAP